jgi:hypothetical protein
MPRGKDSNLKPYPLKDLWLEKNKKINFILKFGILGTLA